MCLALAVFLHEIGVSGRAFTKEGGLSGKGEGERSSSKAGSVEIAGLGDTVQIGCPFQNPATAVSWVRATDMQILSSDGEVFIRDERFASVFDPEKGVWSLNIKDLQWEDRGFYECQVSTAVGVLSHLTELCISLPLVQIKEGAEYHVDVGSMITLTCTVERPGVLFRPPYGSLHIHWLRNGEAIDVYALRGGVSVLTEIGAVSSSKLIVRDSTASDSGTYSCVAPHSVPANISVFVFNDGETAAVHHREVASGQPSGSRLCEHVVVAATISVAVFFALLLHD